MQERGSGLGGVDGDVDELRAGVGERLNRDRRRMSAVSVLVIDCTTIGATADLTLPTRTARVRRRGSPSVRRSSRSRRVPAFADARMWE
jgi:hypothetical protein